LIKVIPPPAVVSEGLSTVPNSIFLSSTCNVVEFIVVVVPYWAQASGNYITGTGSLSAQDLTDIGGFVWNEHWR
jgi:hypothetical protein